MKAFGLPTSAVVVALLSSEATAGPVIKPRAGGWEVAAEIIKLFGDIFKTAKTAFPTDVDAW
jgi:hypothetical protein